jgi:hypothetical protein
MVTRKLLIKVLVAVAVVGALIFLLNWSARTGGAMPYTIDGKSLRHWTLDLNRAAGPNHPVLVLRPTVDFTGSLFNQVFKRSMESMSSPASPMIPLLLQGELRGAGGQLTPETLLAAARDAGLGSTPLQPRCLGYRRVSEARSSRQVYFVLFDSPAFGRFRERIATLLGADSSFDAAAQSPVLFVAVAESNFGDWLPLRANPQKDCVAPIVIESKP